MAAPPTKQMYPNTINKAGPSETWSVGIVRLTNPVSKLAMRKMGKPTRLTVSITIGREPFFWTRIISQSASNNTLCAAAHKQNVRLVDLRDAGMLASWENAKNSKDKPTVGFHSDDDFHLS